MNINQLNDDCLRKVFGYLSLNDLLNLEFVCIRWKVLQSLISEKRLSLKLFGNVSSLTNFTNVANESTMYYDQLGRCCPLFGSCNDYLIVPKLDWFIGRQLVSRFPNLQMLLIDGCHIGQCKVLMFMLSQWSGSLLCLSLVHLIGEVAWKPVLTSIDSLPQLKHLSLFGVEEKLYLKNVFGQLEHFNLGRYEGSLSHLGTGKNICRLGLYECGSSLPQLVNNDRLTHFSFKPDSRNITAQMERSLITFISTNLHNLTNFDFYTENGLRIETLIQLRQLSNLKEFSLHGAEKSDLTSANKAIQDFAMTDQLVTVRRLALNIDFDPAVLEILVLLFPNVEQATINLARLCCSCPETMEEIDIPPQVQDPVPVVRADNLPPPPAPVPPPNLPAPALPEAPQIFEEDNCDLCSERAMLALVGLHSLARLNITGARCKDAALKAIEHLSGELTTLVFASCANYSLKQLLQVCYTLATQHSDRSTQHKARIQLLLNAEMFGRIIKLTNKPENFSVYNVDPVVELDGCWL